MEGELLARSVKEAAEEIKEDVSEIRAMFTGPIPPPDLVQEYENALPGLADRIVRMAEAEAEHRRRMEAAALEADLQSTNRLVDAHIKETHRGQNFALIIAVIGLICGTITAILGAPLAGALLGVGGLAAIVTAFLQGRKQEQPSYSGKDSSPEQRQSGGSQPD
jgi:uncharacterized membrane protein